jgi:hypothetical protein
MKRRSAEAVSISINAIPVAISTLAVVSGGRRPVHEYSSGHKTDSSVAELSQARQAEQRREQERQEAEARAGRGQAPDQGGMRRNFGMTNLTNFGQGQNQGGGNQTGR